MHGLKSTQPCRLGLQLDLSRIETPVRPAIPPQDPGRDDNTPAGAGQTAVSPPASLGHAGTCWWAFCRGNRCTRWAGLSGSLGVSARFGPQDTQKHSMPSTPARCEMGRFSAGFREGNFGSAAAAPPPPPTRRFARTSIAGELAADPQTAHEPPAIWVMATKDGA
jgi:hypothetical protein